MIVRGVVVSGKGEGKKLGFPTANIDYASEVVVESGVYAARALCGGRAWRAAAVVGMWTLPDGRPSVEVHIMNHEARNMKQDLYGEVIVVALYDKIRDLKHFDRPEDLVMQIQNDLRKCSAALHLPAGKAGVPLERGGG